MYEMQGPHPSSVRYLAGDFSTARTLPSLTTLERLTHGLRLPGDLAFPQVYPRRGPSRVAMDEFLLRAQMCAQGVRHISSRFFSCPQPEALLSPAMAAYPPAIHNSVHSLI
jgi:hypothetical protein